MSTPDAGRTERLPLFPLGIVLTPGMPLTLHVFEPRYRQLVADLLNEQDPSAPVFGVVALRSGSEVGELQDLHEVGTTARVTDVLPLPDGRCNLAAVGERRFVVERLDAGSRPYLVGTVRWLAEPDGPLSPGLVLGVRRAVGGHRRALSLLNLDGLDPDGDETDTVVGSTTEAMAAEPDPTAAEPDPTDAGPDPTDAGPDPTDAGPAPAATDPATARTLSYSVARNPWLPLADRQRLLASPDTASRLREARSLLRREIELVSRLRAVPVTAAAFRN